MNAIARLRRWLREQGGDLRPLQGLADDEHSPHVQPGMTGTMGDRDEEKLREGLHVVEGHAPHKKPPGNLKPPPDDAA